jgi:uncharacterized membrane protein YhdT
MGLVRIEVEWRLEVTTQESAQSNRVEARWPPALAVVVLLFLLSVLPGHIQVFPTWFRFLCVAVVLVPMAAVQLSGGHPRWRLVERWITLLFFLVAGAGALAGLTVLIRSVVRGSADLSGLQLFTSSIAVWITNVLAFSLLYWQIDRGGPEARANDGGVRPDWLFPQSGAPEDSPPGWRPTFVDYLFLGFSTATAFSPTDALPLTPRAKLLMMLESAMSLATIVVVAARAINVLGG